MKTVAKRKMFIMVVVLIMSIFSFEGIVHAAAIARDQTVHTIYWKAKLHTTVKKKKKTILKDGSTVVVVKRNYKGGKSVVRYKGGTVKIPNRYLSFIDDLCTGEKGDYSASTKLSFVNKRKGYHSKTGWLIWVSLDKQRVNVFTGSRRKWKLVKVIKCSTGLASSPSKAGIYKCDYKKLWVGGCHYYVEYGGSGIHKWAGSDKGTMYKIGKHTVSQSCIRVTKKNAKWLYNHIPVKTTIVLW